MCTADKLHTGCNQQFQLQSILTQMYRGNYSYSMPKAYASVTLPQTFPEDIECIVKSDSYQYGSLYISNVEAASNINTLKRFRIGAVMSCAKGYQLKHSQTQIPHYKYIPTVDHEECDISIHFEEAVDFITQKLKKTNVLVHCIAGVSRSVSMVLAYFIREHNMHYDQAYNLVKSKRKIIHPNDGFIKQLKRYSQSLKTRTPKKNQNQNQVLGDTRTKSTLVSYSPTLNKTDNYFLQRNRTDVGKVGQPLTPQKNGFSDYSKTMQQYRANQQQQRKKEEVRYKLQDNFMPSYKSSQLTPKKYENESINRTSTNFFTHQNSNANQNQVCKSVMLGKKEDSGRRINAEITPNKYQNKAESLQVTPRAKNTYYQTSSNELSQKIQIIRQKYDLERQKLYQKYQTTQKNTSTIEDRPSTNTYQRDTIRDINGSYENSIHHKKKPQSIVRTQLRNPIRQSNACLQPTNYKNYEPYSAMKMKQDKYARKYLSNTKERFNSFKGGYEQQGYDRYQTLLKYKNYNSYSPLYQYSYGRYP